MNHRDLNECERIAQYLMDHYDNAFSRLEKNYKDGLYTELVYVTIHGFITSMSM